MSISSLTGWVVAAKALNILGFLLGVACLVVGIIYVVVKNEMKILQLVGCILAFTAGMYQSTTIIVVAYRRHILS